MYFVSHNFIFITIYILIDTKLHILKRKNHAHIHTYVLHRTHHAHIPYGLWQCVRKNRVYILYEGGNQQRKHDVFSNFFFLRKSTKMQTLVALTFQPENRNDFELLMVTCRCHAKLVFAAYTISNGQIKLQIQKFKKIF